MKAHTHAIPEGSDWTSATFDHHHVVAQYEDDHLSAPVSTYRPGTGWVTLEPHGSFEDEPNPAHTHRAQPMLEDEDGAPYPHFVQAAAHAAQQMHRIHELGNDLADILLEGIDSFTVDWPERARAAVARWRDGVLWP